VPVAEIARHRLLGRNVKLARSVVDRARGAHLGGEKILELAFAGKAAADPHLLALRRRIDVDAARRGGSGQRIEVGQVNPVRAAIEWHAEALGVGDAAAADMIAGFDHDVMTAGGGEFSRGGDAGRSGTDNDDLDRAGRRRGGAEGRTRRERGGGGEERTSAQSRVHLRHRLRGMVSNCLRLGSVGNFAERARRHRLHEWGTAGKRMLKAESTAEAISVNQIARELA
jgi:hypothetical protein